MKKSTLIFWVDAGLFGLLILTMFMIVPEVLSHTFVHVLPGLLLMAGGCLHICLHWDWIKVAFRQFGKMPGQAQTNALIDLALFVTYILCGWMGLSARVMLLFDPIHHIFLGILHAILAGLLITLQTIHLARHFKWIKMNTWTHWLASASKTDRI